VIEYVTVEWTIYDKEEKLRFLFLVVVRTCVVRVYYAHNALKGCT